MRVEFYANSNRLALTNLPYAFIWTNAPAGIFGMTAKATDLLGATQVSAPVQVIIVAPNTPPSFRVQPLSQTVSNQANVSLSVEVFGSRPFTCQWINDGETIDGATSDTLILNHVEWEDSAHYLVQVSNATGTATSSVATPTPSQAIGMAWGWGIAACSCVKTGANEPLALGEATGWAASLLQVAVGNGRCRAARFGSGWHGRCADASDRNRILRRF